MLAHQSPAKQNPTSGLTSPGGNSSKEIGVFWSLNDCRYSNTDLATPAGLSDGINAGGVLHHRNIHSNLPTPQVTEQSLITREFKLSITKTTK